MVSRRKLLVVEDDLPTRRLLADLLRKNGYSVVEAEHGKAAAKLLKEGLEPCVILTDWIMPGNGADLIKYLRSVHSSPVSIICRPGGKFRLLGSS